MSIFEPIINLKAIFLTETKCEIRFMYVGFKCKGKKQWMEISAIKGGGGFRRLMANAILDFHVFYIFPL